MAVVQVSQIQVRSGLFQDLGQLRGGEFGWAVDALRLFIGNGTLEEGAPYIGNTEVITRPQLLKILGGTGDDGGLMPSFLYRFRGFDGGYEIYSGVDPATPTVRPLQNKLDDLVNVKDFGAKGDGISNDLVPIQRAIDEIYDRLSPQTAPMARRVINFHPGIYIVSGELRIPPYCTLRGGGKNSVIIRQTSTASSCIFRTTNSTGSSDSVILDVGDNPGSIEFENIAFEMNISVNKNVGIVDSAKDVTFRGCTFKGPRQLPITDDGGICVKVTTNYMPSYRIKFQDCEFIGMSTGIALSETIHLENIAIRDCYFYNLYRGITATSTRSVSLMNVRIMSSAFDNVYDVGIDTASMIRGVTSFANTFMNVGCHYTASILTNQSIPVVACIRFGGGSSYSFGDLFLRNFDDEASVPTVEHRSPDAISFQAAQGIRYGSMYQCIGRSVIVDDQTTAYVPLTKQALAGKIDYMIERSGRYRSGTIDFSVNPIDLYVHHRDAYTEARPTNIVFGLLYGNLFNNYPDDRPFLMIKSRNGSNQKTVITFDLKTQDYITFRNSNVEEPYLSQPLAPTTMAPTTTTTTTMPLATTVSYTVTAAAPWHFIVDGTEDPTLYLYRGFTYNFLVGTPGYPFFITEQFGNHQAGTYDAGVINNGTDMGIVTFTVPFDAPSTLGYESNIQPTMGGQINIINSGPPLAIPPAAYSVTNSGASNYQIGEITGSTIAYTANPPIMLVRGGSYRFEVQAPGHPFWIKTDQTTGNGNAYMFGISNNGITTGNLVFTVPFSAPSTLYYNCEFHASMAGILNVVSYPPPPTTTTTSTAAPTTTLAPTTTVAPTTTIAVTTTTTTVSYTTTTTTL